MNEDKVMVNRQIQNHQQANLLGLLCRFDAAPVKTLVSFLRNSGVCGVRRAHTNQEDVLLDRKLYF